ncbi:MAG: AarF/UbiB family protein [Ilumatobacteraceae bacterium]
METTVTAPDTTPDRSPSGWRSVPWRVLVGRFVVMSVALALVVWLMPGLRTSTDLTWFDVALMALTFGLLEITVRPILDLVFVRFIVPTYGLVLLLVDVGVFAVLVLIFSGKIEVSSLTALLIGGALIGLLRIVAEAVLGLTPPVVPEEAGQRRRRPPRGLLKVSPSARELVRLVRIQYKMATHGIDAFFAGEGPVSTFRRDMQTWFWQPSVPLRPISPAERFRLLLEDLGPTFVKIGQIISSQGRGLPSEWLVELDRLQSNVRPYPYEFARQRIIDELGAPPEELYAEFDEEPLAAASLGQVHRARLHNGRDVVVKVQRPGIRGQLQSDVRILVRMSSTLQKRTKWAENFDLTGIVVEFGSTLLRELDYEVEAYNARRLSRVLATVPGVRVPDVEYDLSSAGVLTLEFIPGVKSTNVDAIAAAGLDPERLARNVVDGAVKMLMIDGFFHADPHPGNVFVDLETGEVTMLDTGMVGELTFQQRIRLGSLMMTVSSGDIKGLAQTMKSLSVPFKETDDERYYQDFERKLTPYLDPPPGRPVQLVGRVLPLAVDVLRDGGYRFDPALTLAMKAMAQAEAITRALVPDWTGSNFTAVAVDSLQQQALDAITFETIKDVAISQANFVVREVGEQLPSLTDGVLKWLGIIKRGAVKVEVDTSALDKQIDKLQGVARMLTLGVLVVGLIIGSAIAASTSQLDGSALEPVTDFAATVFSLSAIVGLVWLAVGGIQLLLTQRRRTEDPVDRIG